MKHGSSGSECSAGVFQSAPEILGVWPTCGMSLAFERTRLPWKILIGSNFGTVMIGWLDTVPTASKKNNARGDDCSVLVLFGQQLKTNVLPGQKIAILCGGNACQNY